MACPTKPMCLRVVAVVAAVAKAVAKADEAVDWEEVTFVATLVHHAKKMWSQLS